MRCSPFLGVVCLMASSLAWASSGEPMPQQPAGSTKAAQPSLAEVRQRLARHQAEVSRLEQDVAKQESDSKQASERLQQQDRTITELRQQLQALSAKPASNHQ
jgi:septal ring factor EnvC (AmiA/AmiB activator)